MFADKEDEMEFKFTRVFHKKIDIPFHVPKGTLLLI